MKSVARWISAFASFASIAGLAFIPALPVWIKILILVIGAIALAVLLYCAVSTDRLNRIECRSVDEIHNAMLSMIKNQGKICIMSRDLSWVDEEIMDVFKKKRNSVQIFAQHKNELTKQIEELGIKIMYYGQYGFEPKTRFTIIGYGRQFPQVAIANTQYSVRKKGKAKHTIYQTSKDGAEQDEWINSLALDLIELCLKCCEE